MLTGVTISMDVGQYRHQRARESGLIYEAYYDAVRSDIDEDAGSLPPGRQ